MKPLGLCVSGVVFSRSRLRFRLWFAGTPQEEIAGSRERFTLTVRAAFVSCNGDSVILREFRI
jgi:hypothetical protein